jgi:signal transduction histidine kinase
LALLLGCLLLSMPATIVGTHQQHASALAPAILLTVSCLPLGVRSRFPIPVVVLTAATTAVGYAFAAFPDSGMPPVACAVALFSLASRTDRRTAWATAGCTAVALTTAALIMRPGMERVPMNIGVLAWTSLAVAIGDAVHSRRELLLSVMERAERAEQTKEEEAMRRVTEERIRIARELHDVVAHHITLVNAQAGVAHHLMKTHPENAYLALERIRDTSRSALDELRTTVGLLRGSDESSAPREPTPGLADLDALLDAFHHSGLEVVIERTGEAREIPALTDLTAYRIIQEALTNAHKHAGPGAARVRVELAAESVRISVLNDARLGVPAGRAEAVGEVGAKEVGVKTVNGNGTGTSNGSGNGTGHGMIGMQERAKALGGTFAAGPLRGGGFRVDAVLPVQRA